MSAVKVLRPHAVRPALSTRYQCLRRHESTASSAPPIPPTPQPPPRPKPSFLRRNRNPILFSALALALGLSAGTFITHTLAPPILPDFGTREDALLTADLQSRLENEFKVKVLRGKCLGVSKHLKASSNEASASDREGWVELLPRPGPTQDDVLRGEGLMAQLQGFKGVGVERLFWNFDKRELVAIVWFGGALSGWPGVTHGGVIATQLNDKMSLAAALGRGEGNVEEVETAAAPQRMPGTGEHAKMFLPAKIPSEPTQLTLAYVKPTYANNLYVIRVKPSLESGQEESEGIVPTALRREHEYEAALETLDAKVCVKAKATFDSGNALQRGEQRVVEGVRRSYAEFKEWMWPSRQKNSQMH